MQVQTYGQFLLGAGEGMVQNSQIFAIRFSHFQQKARHFLRAAAESNIYHVIVRGVGSQIIFETDADRLKYLRLLDEKFPEEGVGLLAWCLMDNHAHLLLAAPVSALSKAMRRVD